EPSRRRYLLACVRHGSQTSPPILPIERLRLLPRAASPVFHSRPPFAADHDGPDALTYSSLIFPPQKDKCAHPASLDQRHGRSSLFQSKVINAGVGSCWLRSDLRPA